MKKSKLVALIAMLFGVLVLGGVWLRGQDSNDNVQTLQAAIEKTKALDAMQYRFSGLDFENEATFNRTDEDYEVYVRTTTLLPGETLLPYNEVLSHQDALLFRLSTPVNGQIETGPWMRDGFQMSAREVLFGFLFQEDYALNPAAIHSIRKQGNTITVHYAVEVLNANPQDYPLYANGPYGYPYDTYKQRFVLNQEGIIETLITNVTYVDAFENKQKIETTWELLDASGPYELACLYDASCPNTP